MLNALVIGLTMIAAPSVEVTVTPMRGETVVGTLVDVNTRQVVIGTTAGERTFESSQLLGVEPTAAAVGPVPRSEKVDTVVTLVDGSVLHARQYAVSRGRATVVLLDDSEVTVSTRAIGHVRMMAVSPATRTQWEQVVASPRQSDAIVIRKTAEAAEGSDPGTAQVALDAPEGVLGEIDEASVRFELDDTPVSVSRRKVQGVIYYHRTTSTPRDPICRLSDASGSHWYVRSLKFEADEMSGITVSGVRFSMPLAKVTMLDYSVGNIGYLSDLPRESVVWKPRRNIVVTPSAERWFGPKFDTGRYGSVLKLDDEAYEKGLALHSYAEVTYRLTKRYRSLLARVGVDDESRYEADLELRIFGDNREIFSRRIKGQDEPFDLELDMAGIRRLKIVVDYGGDNSERGDNLNLCNARLTK